MNKNLRIAVGGSAANPPHIGHKELIYQLLKSEKFDIVIWIISGEREDKIFSVTPHDRVAMTQLTIERKWLYQYPKLVISYEDVYGENTPSIKVIERLKTEYPNSEITWFTGSDSLAPQERYDGKCEVEIKWFRGKNFFKETKFLAIKRGGYSLPENLPENIEVFDAGILGGLPDISSSYIRDLVASQNQFEDLVTPEVASYIKVNNLYKGEPQ